MDFVQLRALMPRAGKRSGTETRINGSSDDAEDGANEGRSKYPAIDHDDEEEGQGEAMDIS